MLGHHFPLLAVLSAVPVWFASAAPIAINVVCNSTTVGTISVDTSAGGSGVQGTFTSTTGGPPPTLAAAAAACGEHHFNWYQILTADNMPPNDADGNPLSPPYVDPPPGGYSSQWADNLPWYWDEFPPPPGTPGYDTNLLLTSQTTASVLNFSDFPGGGAGTNLSFRTWLVSLNEDASFHSFHGGFSWDWSNSTGKDVASNLKKLEAGPTKAEYAKLIDGFETRIPEPSALYLVAGGVAMLGLLKKCLRC